MTDLELQGLIAIVNDQTARVEAETARAKVRNEAPNTSSFYDDTYVDNLRQELANRGVI